MPKSRRRKAPAGRRSFAADGLKADIRRRIATGRMPPGARIPPARDLAKDYSLSYATCHKALAELEADGLIRRHQGRGTFVAECDASSGEVSLRLRLIGDAKTRVYAAATLGKMGPLARVAVPALRKALTDPARKVRTAAAAALRRIVGAPEKRPASKRAIDTEKAR